MAKVTEPQPVELNEVFSTGADGRLYCAFCTYDTNLPGAARRHTLAKHKTNLKPLAIIVPDRGVVPAEMPTEIIVKPVAPVLPEATGEGA